MHFYMSGTPKNDKWQAHENEICSHRLFSLHGSYKREVLKWLRAVKENPERKYPPYLMLDSGAFSAWNAGKEAHLSEVIDGYEEVLWEAEDLFKEIWMINLDKIPGEAGRDPTQEEIRESVRISDENLKVLVDKFGDRILPVFHQGEDLERLYEVAEMANYICVSPRNDVKEHLRRDWAKGTHIALAKRYPDAKTHGLATTGNDMLKQVPWYSVDSAAWVLHGVYGMLTLFMDGGRYRTITFSNESTNDADEGRHYESMSVPEKREMAKIIESHGYTVEQCKSDPRVRHLLNMREFLRYMVYVEDFKKQASTTKLGVSYQTNLLGEL